MRQIRKQVSVFPARFLRVHFRYHRPDDAGDIMNIREAQKIIREEELPASEAALLLDSVNDQCIHYRAGACQLIEECACTEPYDGIEPF